MRKFLLIPAGFLALAATLPARAATPAGYVTGIFLGSPDPNSKVPTVNGVPGAGVGNFSVPVPQVVITHGQRYAISIFAYDASFAGNAATSYAITQVQSGHKVTLLKGPINAKFTGAAGTYWLWFNLTGVIPANPGAATLTGYGHFGKTLAKLSVPILIQ